MRKRKVNEFTEYLNHLNDSDVKAVKAFMVNFKQHMNLTLSEEKKLRKDLEGALMYYNAIGVAVTEALRRLDNENLGGFYARPPLLYYALDDAAKIYPLSMKHGFQAVFRLSANLFDEVVPQLLQIALTFTIKRFPRFATTLKKGFFWHYLDANKQRYGIEKEEHLPCRPIKVATTGSKSFRVLYYKNRVSVEFFHCLTDGRGGLVFLQTLLDTYLRLFGVEGQTHPSILDINATPLPEEDANEFKRTTVTKRSGFKEKRALQMSGKIENIRPTQILHFRLDATDLYKVAKRYGVTITAYILGLILLASRFATDAKDGDIAIQVPVDLRKYYPSSTLANFSLYGGIRMPITDITTMEELLPLVKDQLAIVTSYEKMSEMMYSAHRMNKDVRGFPLFLKNPIAKLAYGIMGEAIFTTTFSNLGIISAPDHFNDYIESYDFVLGPPEVNRAATTLVTYNNIATLTITKSTKDPSFEEEIYRLLVKDGLAINIEGSAVYERKSRVSREKD
ncbi:MAG: hypothetical protein BWX74_00426 [Tenericutes bacterium ADurb.Bin087]|nr:MAG: hypothetical protein BWX74_00426 [Tenericutes bacterium ADurb.Bin087]